MRWYPTLLLRARRAESWICGCLRAPVPRRSSDGTNDGAGLRDRRAQGDAERVRAGRPRAGRVEQEIRSLGTTSDQLLELREWLTGGGVTHVAIEATGVYWKPVYYGEVISHRFARRTTCARRGPDADLLSGGRWGAPLARSRTSSRRGPGLLLRR